LLQGLLYTCVGLLRLGWLTHYLSHAVVSGFMTGASITIAMSQVKYLLGASLCAHRFLVHAGVHNSLYPCTASAALSASSELSSVRLRLCTQYLSEDIPVNQIR